VAGVILAVLGLSAIDAAKALGAPRQLPPDWVSYYAAADWVVVDTRHPWFYDREDRRLHEQVLGRLVLDRSFQSVFAQDGVFVFKRVAPSGSSSTPPS